MTRRERQAQRGPLPAGAPPAPVPRPPPTAGAAPLPPQEMAPGTHLHCVACGKHLDTVGEARARAAAGRRNELWVEVRCGHGSPFWACFGCLTKAKKLLDEHDRSGEEVRAAAPWH